MAWNMPQEKTMLQTCDIRERFVGDYVRALNLYHGKFSQLLETISIDAAAKQVIHFYHAAVHAQAALTAHESRHGCGDRAASVTSHAG